MTPKQSKTLVFIENFIDENGFSPSYSEIAEGLSLSGKGGVGEILDSLSQEGYITYRKRASRSICLVDPVAQSVASVLRSYDDNAITEFTAFEKLRHIIRDAGAAI